MKRFFYILALCGTLTITAGAQEAEFSEALARASASVEAIACDFTLTRTMSFMASDVVSKGNFHYLRDTGISLDFTEPAGEQITMGSGKFRIVAGGRTTVVRVDSNPALRQLQRMLTACMSGDVTALREGAQSTVSRSGDRYVVTIVPDNRRARGMIERIVLTFERGNMSLESLRMEEASGDVSVYEFYNKTFNGAFEAARFDIR